jgi:hypothetical protein
MKKPGQTIDPAFKIHTATAWLKTEDILKVILGKPMG